MSEPLLVSGVWAIALVLVTALVTAALVARAHMGHIASKAIREEERDERDTGVVAQLKRQVEQNDAVVRAMLVDWKTFTANNRR